MGEPPLSRGSDQIRNPKSEIRNHLHWLLLLLFTFIICAPLTYPGYLQVHSGFLPVYNLYDLEAQGGLTWAPVVGRDFDLLRGEGILPYALAEAIRWLGASGVTAVKVVFGLGLGLGALGMYGWARRLLGGRGALLAALVYGCWPYGLATVYVRGALAETLFLGLLPWTLWALQRLLDGCHRWGAVLVAGSVALLSWTQPGLALWAAVALLAYELPSFSRSEIALKGSPDPRLGPGSDDPGQAKSDSLRQGTWRAQMEERHRPSAISHLLAGVLGGLLLGAIRLWPLAAARGMGGTAIIFSEHFVYPFQLLSAAWGHGLSIPGWRDDLPLQLGLVAVGLAAVAVYLLAGGPVLKHRAERAKPAGSGLALVPTLWACAGLVLVLTFLTLTWAAPLWRLPGLSWVGRALTYPWQLLALVGPFLALLAGSVVPLGLGQKGEGEGLPLWAALIALTLLSSYGYLEPRTTRYEPSAAPLAVLGENEILLLDAQVEGTLRPGHTVRLSVHWQPLRPLAKDYTVFVHAVDETERIWGQQDTQPQSGKHPTSQWQVGEVIEDRYELRIAADGPPEGYHLNLGLYDWQSGERMRVGDDDKIVIGKMP